MSASAKEVLKKTLTAIESETVPCERCNGYGYHHGFGEHGHDPDWCVVCGGAQVVPAHDGEKAPEILLTALSAAGFVVVPMEPTEEMKQAAAENSKITDVYEADSVWRAMLSAEGKK
ncbi:MAG TPA: hypothetical protein DCL48_12120 [Alphaproteobacteria bacterium]|nr:hypothetical protein [Alphaproteobacteria bacterium]